MGTKDFNKPVILRLNQEHVASFRADNAAEALDYLKRFWSGARTREYRRAYAICQSALDNLVSAESARAYLVAAAERAGILYRHGDRSHALARRTPAQASAPANHPDPCPAVPSPPALRPQKRLARFERRGMFMQINHPATLTLDDHAVLERLMCTLSGSPKPIASLLRRKLETAVILHPGAATDDLVTSGRRVRYWVNGELEADHYLTWEHPKAGDASAISLQSPLGLALLGLRTGQSISFPSEAGIKTAEVTGVNAVPGHSSGSAPQLSAIASKLQGVASIIKRKARLSLAHLQKGRAETTLMRLSDATLKDIGITRGEIPYVAGIVAGLAPATSPTRPNEHAGKVRHLDSREGPPRSTGRSITDVRNENSPARLFA